MARQRIQGTTGQSVSPQSLESDGMVHPSSHLYARDDKKVVRNSPPNLEGALLYCEGD